jgi:hypothetical protein
MSDRKNETNRTGNLSKTHTAAHQQLFKLDISTLPQAKPLKIDHPRIMYSSKQNKGGHVCVYLAFSTAQLERGGDIGK